MNDARARPLLLVQGSWLLDQLSNLRDRYDLQLFAANEGTGEIAGAEVLAWDGSPLSSEALDRLPSLRLVAGFATGYGGVALRGLRARGITLTNAAGVNAHDVADHAVVLTLGLWHRLLDYDRAVRDGRGLSAVPMRPSLRGRNVGVAGLGRIGRAIADRMAAHEVTVRWWGPRAKADVPYERAAGLVELAAWADILVVASRAVEENRGQIDTHVLDALGPDGMLVNISRGMLVDEESLIARLKDGRLGGAALDVFAQEPTPPERWAGLPNLLLTPHAAGATQEALGQLLGQLEENVRRYFVGEPLLSPVDDPA